MINALILFQKKRMKQRILLLTVLCSAVLAGSACSDEPEPVSKVYNEGDFYEVGTIRGVVFEISDDGLHGLVVSLDETAAQWATERGKTAAMSDSDGVANQAAIEAIDGWQTKYPAFAWCAAKNTLGGVNWFLPASDQLKELYDTWSENKTAFNKSLTDNGGTPIIATSSENEYFWSSTDSNSSSGELFAVAFMFSQGVYDFPFKTDMKKVRAVHAF